MMAFIERLLRRKEPAAHLPAPVVPSHDRNEVEHLKSYERELQHRDRELDHRMRALDLDIDVMGRRPRE